MKKIIGIGLLGIMLLCACQNKSRNDGVASRWERSDKASSVSEPDLAPPLANKAYAASPAPPSGKQFASNVKLDELAESVSMPIEEDYHAIAVSNPMPTEQINSKIIKNAELNMQVDDYAAARKELNKLIKQYKCYVGSENESTEDGKLEDVMLIRIEPQDFEKAISDISAIAKRVDTRNVTVEDVTAKFVDTESRLKAKREAEKRYLDLLKQAKKVSDIVEIQEKLDGLHEEIEAKEGELKLLNNQVQYSSIHLKMYQVLPYTPSGNKTAQPGFGYRTQRALSNGWTGVVNFVLLLIVNWPFFAIAILIMLWIRQYRRRKASKGN